MPNSHYDWKDGPAKLQQHSVAKHNLLRGYLAAYFPTLISHQQDELRLTIVDGFAGGGAYHHDVTGEFLLGSPFICLQAAAEAEARINHIERVKKVRFNVDYIFVEKDRNAASYLTKTIAEQGYASRMSKDIHLLQGDFNTHADDIIAHVHKKTPKSGRSIFILDQYGYTKVPMALLAKIFQTLPKAEVILTFNVDSFNSYASDKSSRSPLENIGLTMAQTGLGVALRKLRERRTLSLREMGQLSEVDHAYVHRLETGEKASPTGELLSKLIKVLKPDEREVEIVKWLAVHPDADPGLVEYVIDNKTVDLFEFTAAAGARHRGNARPDPATLIARIRKAFSEEDD